MKVTDNNSSDDQQIFTITQSLPESRVAFKLALMHYENVRMFDTILCHVEVEVDGNDVNRSIYLSPTLTLGKSKLRE